MPIKRLATFVHVSDLHFGLPDEHGDAVTERHWRYSPWFDGLFGHEYLALRALETFFENLKRTERARLIVTGDLTRTAAPAEFAMFASYASDELVFSEARRAGLHEGDWRHRAIPGNHDHWPGSGEIFGGPNSAMADTFGKMTRVSAPMTLPDGTLVRFLRIDTDADVHPQGSQRLFARGSFLNELQLVDDVLRTRPLQSAEIRVLLMHHSVSHDNFRLGIDRTSRGRLGDLVAQHGVRMILSGHTHVSCVTEARFEVVGGELFVPVATCGSSTQRAYAPPKWGRAAARKAPNSLLVHRLWSPNSGRVVWEVKTYIQRAEGFIEAPRRRKLFQM